MVHRQGLQLNNTSIEKVKTAYESRPTASFRHTEHDARPALPIVFWIYGGSNVIGSVGFYLGLENLPRTEDVCLVAANYRLGVFGFLSLSEFAKGDPRGTAGNYGLTDLQAALQWVNANAGAFGCDPTRVTLYGQSSGGTNILALLANKSTRKLISGAVSLSASTNISAPASSVDAAQRPVRPDHRREQERKHKLAESLLVKCSHLPFSSSRSFCTTLLAEGTKRMTWFSVCD